jgi:3-hydroxybutyryl-CoA dehydrogenase
MAAAWITSAILEDEVFPEEVKAMATKRFTKPKQGAEGRAVLPRTASVSVGVVGLGLMGRSIVTCLLAAGHPVVGVTRSLAQRPDTRRRVYGLLRGMQGEGLLAGNPRAAMERLQLSEDFSALSGCGIVLESGLEDLPVKREIIRKVEEVVSPEALIGNNTSALPVTELQRGARHPERIMGIHWGEPAHVLRFMEIICGNQTRLECAERAMQWAQRWDKEPTLVRCDVRGFISNRFMYAMLREAFHLIEGGCATVEDIDRACRNDYGYWMTFAGLFRYMDLTGIPAYMAVMRDLFPDLSCNQEIPQLMRKVVESGARGIENAKGFYKYTPAEARRWEKKFLKFSYEIRALAQKHHA